MRNFKHAFTILVLCLTGAMNFVIFQNFQFASQFHLPKFSLETAKKIALPECNSTAFTQVPNADGRIFIGRSLFDSGCNPLTSNRKLVEFDFDWQTRTFTRSARGILVQPGDVTADGYTIHAAYDPNIVQFRGEYWIAFECSLTGVKSTSLCTVPWSQFAGVDKNRMSVVVLGEIDARQNLYSASVGKLLVHQNRLYAYWSAIKMKRSSPTAIWKWDSITTRGMEVEVRSVAGGSQMIYPIRSDTPVHSFDPLYNVEVLGLRNELESNTVADAFGFYSDGTHVYSTTALGGSDCLITEPKNSINTSAKVPGCYRLGIFASNHPLTYRGFNINKIPNSFLFGNWQSYTRLVIDPQGKKHFLGHYGRGTVPIPESPLLPVGNETSLFLYPAPDHWSDFFPNVRSPKFPRSCDLKNLRSLGLIVPLTEVNKFKVSLLFCLVLGRLPERKGEHLFLNAFSNNQSLDLLIEGVFQSKEYQQVHQPDELSDENYVSLLYQTFLGRKASTEEIHAQVQRILSGDLNRETLRASILHSNEFHRLNELFFR